MNFTTLAKNLQISHQKLLNISQELGLKLTPKMKKINKADAEKIQNYLQNQQSKNIQETKEEKDKTIIIPKVISVKDLANKLNKPPAEVIKRLMHYGVLATINENVDYDTASLIAIDFGFQTKETTAELEKETLTPEKLAEILAKQDPQRLKPRPPVVVVMGHVDHGKTTLLDAIRSTDVAAKEYGGITQRISSYQVKKKGKLITFLDTPGHEAFYAMRERGANITDLAILVVAADDGVKPQTIEAIEHAKKAEVPIIVAINKIDKPGVKARIPKIKKELSDHGVLTEEWGGDTVCVEVSALKKIGLDQLLEMILLVSEMQDLTADPDRPALGSVIEAHLDKHLGPVASILIQTGTLHKRDYVVVGKAEGRIRSLEDFRGKSLSSAPPSTPVFVTGLKNVPRAGDILQVVSAKKEAKSKIAALLEEKKLVKGLTKISKGEEKKEKEIKHLHLVLRTDNQGSLEAIKQTILAMNTKEVAAHFVVEGLGSINETDITMAESAKAQVLGFNVAVNPLAKELAEKKKVTVAIFQIIYDLVRFVKEKMEELLPPEIIITPLGKLEVLKVFFSTRDRKIVGGKVIKGKIVNKAKVKQWRNGALLSQGKITQVQQQKKDVEEVREGLECGLSISGIGKIKPGDFLEVYFEEIKKRRLQT